MKKYFSLIITLIAFTASSRAQRSISPSFSLDNQAISKYGINISDTSNSCRLVLQFEDSTITVYKGDIILVRGSRPVRTMVLKGNQITIKRIMTGARVGDRLMVSLNILAKPNSEGQLITKRVSKYYTFPILKEEETE